MNLEDQLAAEEIIAELERRRVQNKIDQFYATQQNRDSYPMHMEFFAAGAKYRERLMCAANRVGKTEGVLCYEVSLHMTGLYPEWWTGKRFNRPVSGWLGGDTATTTRDILQAKLLGDVGNFGTGLLRADLIVDTTNKRGVPDAVEFIKVRHVSGGVSIVGMKSYDQGRTAWQGTEKDFVGLDEEPPEEIYSEAIIRTMTTGGIILSTYTPMYGMTELTQSFFDIDKADSKFVCTATWDDVGHLTKEIKDELWKAIPVHERDARAKGIPTIGVGKIYPVDLAPVVIEPIKIPPHWMRGYALDVGWNKTAALWGALDRDSDTLYIYSEHYRGEAEPAVHASAIKARGALQGQIDPASRGRSQHDGKKLIQLYRNEGLTLVEAENSVETGIFEVYQRLSTGRLRIFNTCANLLKELPLYHRDKNGAIVKKNDHACDCFHGDTLVRTLDGDVPIKELVGTSGYVLSLGGKFEKYHSCAMYRQDSDMVRLTYADGRQVVCTPEHQFMNIKGEWVQAKDMLLETSYEVTPLETTWKSKSFAKHSKSSWATAIGYAASTFSDMAFGFTEKFGKRITAAFQLVSTFITKMKIEPTMTSQTWNCFLPQRTFHYTQKESQTQTFTWPLKKPKNGMQAKKGSRGIVSTCVMTAKRCIEKFSKIVSTALNSLKLSIKQKTSFVPTTAKLLHVAQAGLITSRSNAPYAMATSYETSTTPMTYAGNLAATNAGKAVVVKIESVENADSYCLMVDTTHAFTVCGGIVVHNCLRYLCSGINVLSYSSETDGNFAVTSGGTRYLSSRPVRQHRHHR